MANSIVSKVSKPAKFATLLDRVSESDAKRLEAMHADILKLSSDNKTDAADSLALRKVSGYLYDAMQMAIVDKPVARAYDPDKDYLFALLVELDQATAIIDLLYTVATEKQVDGLFNGTIENSLHTVLQRLGAVREAVQAIEDEQTVVLGQVAA
jgi:hypothetical protein